MTPVDIWCADIEACCIFHPKDKKMTSSHSFDLRKHFFHLSAMEMSGTALTFIIWKNQMQELSPETVLLTKYTFKDDIFWKPLQITKIKKIFTRQFPNLLQLLYNKEKLTGNVYNKLILKCWQQRKIWRLVSINVKIERQSRSPTKTNKLNN